jgi:hypothetical protein
MYEEACEIVPKEGAKVKRVIKIMRMQDTSKGVRARPHANKWHADNIRIPTSISRNLIRDQPTTRLSLSARSIGRPDTLALTSQNAT